MTEQILFVDDDMALLQGIKRALYPHFDLMITTDSTRGLAYLKTEEVAVVVSDMRMSPMNGIEFLTRVKQHSPNTTRMLLTGFADLHTAIDAVNSSHIFRLLTKPIDPENLTLALNAGLEQYRLLKAEQVLLSQTLVGSVRALIELIGSIYPPALRRASRLKGHIHRMVTNLHIDNAWQYEIAAMLSQIGYVAAPVELLRKLDAGQELSDEEQALLLHHGMFGVTLVNNIPRLETIADMIAGHYRSLGVGHYTTLPHQRPPVILGAQMLQTAVAYEDRICRGLSSLEAAADMQSTIEFDPILLNGLML